MRPGQMQTQPQLGPPDSAMGQAERASAEAVEAGLLKAGQVPVADGLLTRRPVLARMAVELDVAVPMRTFRVRDLLDLAEGQVLETKWVHGEDLPLSAPGSQLAWSGFEVIDTKLAVRITRLV